MSILVRNERRKLLASYLNSIASGCAIGGSLPLFVNFAMGTARPGDGPFLLMLFAFALSGLIFSVALWPLNRLEDSP
jgi:hypothetical protein